MKVTWIYYNDDDILIAGHLIKRFFRKPVFYPFERECGFDCQYITGRDQMVKFTEEDYRTFYKEKYPAGTKIKVIAMRNERTLCRMVSEVLSNWWMTYQRFTAYLRVVAGSASYRDLTLSSK